MATSCLCGAGENRDETNISTTPSYGSQVSPTHPGIDRIKADVLVAFTTGAHIELYLGDATCMVTETRLTP